MRDAESAELARVRIPSWLRWSEELPVPPSAVTEDLRDVCFPSTLSNYSDSSLSCRIGPETVDLLDKLLVCNPRERLTASQALDHDYFWTDPLPADPKTCVTCLVSRFWNANPCPSFDHSLPTYEASHEFDKRGRRHQAPAAPQAPPTDGAPRPLPQPGGMGMHGRPPPPRETFRNGPLPVHYPPPPPIPGAPAVYGTHALPYVPPRQYQPVPPPTLPPISLRPGQPPPQILHMPMMVQALPPPPQPYGRLPTGLPQRPPPPVPAGRPGGPGPGYRQGGYGGGGELNYG